MRYEYMKPQDYRKAKDTAPIAYIPWGAHEWHGLHCPLGLDTLKAHALCLQLCAETGGVVFPPVYCGFQTMKPYAGFDCTLEFSRELVQEHVREYLLELTSEGFRVIVIVMGHYGGEHQRAIQEVVTEFNASQKGSIAWAFPDYEPTVEHGFPGDHAGPSETSYMMYFHPELVDLARLPDREISVEQDGIVGDPRTASAKRGRHQANVFVQDAACKIKRLLETIGD